MSRQRQQCFLSETIKNYVIPVSDLERGFKRHVGYFFGALNDHVGHPAYRFEPSGRNDMLTADTLYAAHLARLGFFFNVQKPKRGPSE